VADQLANPNKYMFMVGQDLPGRGKRELRAAVAEKDIALAQTDVMIPSDRQRGQAGVCDFVRRAEGDRGAPPERRALAPDCRRVPGEIRDRSHFPAKTS
jgi:hypothetical protein